METPADRVPISDRFCIQQSVAKHQFPRALTGESHRHDHAYPDFAFAQHQSPELAPPDWRPHYVDYLILGLTTSTAFSPTDVLPMSRWAKLAMALQSIISLLTIGLVIARAVNIFQ